MDATCPNCQNPLQIGIAHFSDSGEPGELEHPEHVKRIDVAGFGSCHHCLTVLWVQNSLVSAATPEQIAALPENERENLEKILSILAKTPEHEAWFRQRCAIIMQALADVLDEHKVTHNEGIPALTALLVPAMKRGDPNVTRSCFLQLATALGFNPLDWADSPEAN